MSVQITNSIAQSLVHPNIYPVAPCNYMVLFSVRRISAPVRTNITCSPVAVSGTSPSHRDHGGEAMYNDNNNQISAETQGQYLTTGERSTTQTARMPPAGKITQPEQWCEGRRATEAAQDYTTPEEVRQAKTSRMR